MSAINATSARERAQIAARVIVRGGKPTRNFDSCLEMGDGDEVVRILRDMCKRSPKLRANIDRYITPEAKPKTFREQMNVGHAKYVVSFHDGVKTHGDGSPFFDVQIFSNQIEKEKFVQSLITTGYTAEV